MNRKAYPSDVSDDEWAFVMRCLARDYERLAAMLSTFHVIAFAMLMTQRFVQLLSESH